MKLTHLISLVGLLTYSLLNSACTSLNSVSLTSIPAQKGNEVRAERSRLIFLAFNFNNDFVDEMTEDLRAQCPNGQIQGLLTKDETVMYFGFIVYRRRVVAEGFCQTPGALRQRSRAS